MRLEEDPVYEKVRAELDPLITGIIVADKTDFQYLRFKNNISEWDRRFTRTLRISGEVESMQRVQILMEQLKARGKGRLLSVISLFRYLGLAESVGASVLDMVVLLLVANGHDFHVERPYDLPRIVHVTTFDDLGHASLAEKIAFLGRNGLKETSKLIDRRLRNDIAHLDFEISDQGKVSTKNYPKGVNVLRRIDELTRKFAVIMLIISKSPLSRYFTSH